MIICEEINYIYNSFMLPAALLQQLSLPALSINVKKGKDRKNDNNNNDNDND